MAPAAPPPARRPLPLPPLDRPPNPASAFAAPTPFLLFVTLLGSLPAASRLPGRRDEPRIQEALPQAILPPSALSGSWSLNPAGNPRGAGTPRTLGGAGPPPRPAAARTEACVRLSF